MVTVLTGDNTLAIKKRLDELVEKFVKQHGELAVERLDGEEAEAQMIFEAAQSLAFLTPKKLLIIRGLSENKAAAENIEQIISSVPESTDLVLHEPVLDKRSSYYKFLKKQPGFEEHAKPGANELPKWLVGQAKNEGGEISLTDAAYLVQKVGPEPLALASELTKLITYDLKISRESIDLLVEANPQSRIFDLLDAAFTGSHGRTLELYEDQRQQRVEPQAILAMIAWQLQALAVVKMAGERSPAEIAKQSGLNPFVISKSRVLARQISPDQLKKLVGEALDIDYRSKTSAVDLDEALKNYLISL